MNFEERKNVPQNAKISAAQEFRTKRKDFSRKRKKFRGNARRKKARNPTATCIYTKIHQKWSSDISFHKSHWDLQPCRNQSWNSCEFQLLFQSERLTNFDWNCSVLLAIRRCFECFRVLLLLSCAGWLPIDSRLWALVAVDFLLSCVLRFPEISCVFG